MAHQRWLDNPVDPNGKRALLCGANLGGYYFEYKNFQWADLRGVRFYRLLKTKFHNADLRDSIFEDAVVMSWFDGADLRGAKFRGARIESSVFPAANLERSDFSEATLGPNAIFRLANLKNSRLMNTKVLQYSSFDQANLLGAKLQGAKFNKLVRMHDANFQNVQMSKETYIPYEILKTTNSWILSLFLGKDELSLGIPENLALKRSFHIIHNRRVQDKDLSDFDLSEVNFRNADLTEFNLQRANLTNAILTKAKLPQLAKGENKLLNANLSGARLDDVDLTNVGFDLKPGSIPDLPSMAKAMNLDRLKYQESPKSLVEIRNAFKYAGMRDEERILTYVVKHLELESIEKNDLSSILLYYFLFLFFEWPCKWGLEPFRPLVLMIELFLWLIPVYSAITMENEGNHRIWKVWDKDLNDDQKMKSNTPVEEGLFKALLLGSWFSLLSTLRIGWRDLNVGTWLSRLQFNEYNLRATGWVRTVSGFQSLISVYLLALWALTYFGRPFE